MESEARLYHQIAGEYDVVIKTIEVAPAHCFDLLMVKDADALLDKIDPEAFKRDERLPYWAELWPASVALAEHLLSCPMPCNARVLELGCGLGLPAVVAARSGCTVLATDYEETALKFARYNAARNGVSDRIAFQFLDWRTADPEERFSHVIASDIWFDKGHIPHLLRLVDRALQDGGTLVASDPGRWGIGPAFVEELVERGYDHWNTTIRVDLGRNPCCVQIHRLRRPPGQGVV
jgi:predicted nicotinamide N-methyase